MDLNAVTKILDATMPTVKAVLVEATGDAHELEVDMTPRVNAVAQLMGTTSITFVGQVGEDVVAVAGVPDSDAADEEKDDAGSPVQALPFPLHDVDVAAVGKVLLTRSDARARPQDFTLGEFEMLKAHVPTKAEIAMFERMRDEAEAEDAAQEEAEEGDSEEEGLGSLQEGGEDSDEDFDVGTGQGGDDEDQGDDQEVLLDILREKIRAKFEAESSREATEDEVDDLLAALLQSRSDARADEDEAGEGDNDEQENKPAAQKSIATNASARPLAPPAKRQKSE